MCKKLLVVGSFENRKRTPLLVRRGGRDTHEMERSLLNGADGVVNHKAYSECAVSTRLVRDHPVCGAKDGFADFLLMPQPPLLTRRGLTPLRFKRPHYQLPKTSA